MLLKATPASLFLLNKRWNKLAFITLCVVLISTVTAFSQVTKQQTSLIKVLKQVEKKFDVKFSYNRRDIKLITLENFSISEELAPTLEELSTSASLLFTKIKERYIAVQLQETQQVSVCGILIETESSIPIADAEITVGNRSIRSDSGGNFNLSEISEKETVSIFVNGFFVRSITATELSATGQCPFIYISQTYTYLPEVILTNYLTKGISKNAAGETQINNENFDILPSLIEPDVLQIAQALPGISSADETASNLNVRGGTSDEFLILWDDVRMYQSGHFFGLISAFNPNLTKNVTLYKNGTHARYGEGVSGVIAMESTNTIPDSFTGGVGVNLTSANAYAEIPATENFLLTVSGRASINTGIGNPVYNQFFDRVFQNTVVTNLQNNTIEGERTTDEAFNFFDVSAKALWKLSNKDQLTYHFLLIDNKLQFSERIINSEIGSLIASELKQQSSTNAIDYKRDWTRNFSTKLAASTSTYQRNEFSNNVDLNLLNSNQNEVIEKTIKLNINYALTDAIQLTTGYQYTDTQITDSQRSSVNQSLQELEKSLFSNALFASGSFSLYNGNTNITSGLRITQYPTLSETFIEPRLYINQRINKTFRVFLSGELKHQSVYQRVNLRNNLLGVETNDWLLADNQLNPILESKQLGVGGSFNTTNWTVTSEVYLKEVKGINSDNLGFRNQLQELELQGLYVVKGAELSINKRAAQWNFWLSYTFQENMYQFKNFTPATFSNNLESPHSITLAGSYDYKNFKFSLGNTFRSGLPYTLPVQGEEIITSAEGSIINFDAPNAARLPTYFRSDFSASYELELDETFSGKIHLAFLNIFNRKNALNRYYVLDQNDTGVPSLRRVDQFSLGFTPNISLQLLF